MMTVGILVLLTITFTLLHEVLNILSKENSIYKDEKKSIIGLIPLNISDKKAQIVVSTV